MITIVCPIIIDNDSGGGTKSTIALMNGLAERNNQFIVYLILNPSCTFIQQLDKNINIAYFTTNPIISISKPIQFFKVLLFIFNFLKKFDSKNTIAFATDRPGLMMMLFIAKRYSIFYVSRGWFYTNLSAKYLIKIMFPKVKKFICISDKQYNVIEQLTSNKENIHVIYNGFKFTDKKFIPFQNAKLIKISTIGVICTRKAQMQCLEMINLLIQKYEIDNLVLQIYGQTLISEDEVYYNDLLRYISENKLETYVKFMGHEKNIEYIYENTDIVVSSAMEEGFGRTIIEAMNYGIPVIANQKAGGPSSIITNNLDGFLYNGTSEDLAKCIVSIINNIELRNKFIKNGILTAKNKFSVENMVENYSRLIINYIKNKQ